jgi:hypothetical protein
MMTAHVVSGALSETALQVMAKYKVTVAVYERPS